MSIKSRIRTIPDYPKKGVMFRDITTLIKDPVGFRLVIDNLAQHYVSEDLGFEFDIIVGIEVDRASFGCASHACQCTERMP